MSNLSNDPSANEVLFRLQTILFQPPKDKEEPELSTREMENGPREAETNVQKQL